MSKRRLGKGIDALLQGRDLEQLSTMSSILMVEIDKLQPNPEQPRTRFNEDTLRELAESIREKGVLQPILAEDRGDGTYIIVAGERRHRAARIAGLDEVPVIPSEFSEEEKLEIALVENLQREDLNAIDEALAFESAIKRAGYTQEQLATRLGKSRPAIANSLRLLRLEPEIKSALADGTLSAGQARPLLSIAEPAKRLELFRRIIDEQLSVREIESFSRPPETSGTSPGKGSTGEKGAAGAKRGETADPGRKDAKKAQQLSPELRRIEERLVERFGAKVKIRGDENQGELLITYHDSDGLGQLLEILGITPE